MIDGAGVPSSFLFSWNVSTFIGRCWCGGGGHWGENDAARDSDHYGVISAWRATNRSPSVAVHSVKSVDKLDHPPYLPNPAHPRFSRRKLRCFFRATYFDEESGKKKTRYELDPVGKKTRFKSNENPPTTWPIPEMVNENVRIIGCWCKTCSPVKIVLKANF